MLKRNFISSYVMAVFMLVGMVIAYVLVTMIRHGISDLGGVVRFSIEGSISENVLAVLSLFLLSLLPTIWISARDETHFGIFGLFRWFLVGILSGGLGGVIAQMISFPSQSSALSIEMIAFLLRIIVGLIVIGVSYWLVFKMPGMVSKGNNQIGCD